MAAHRVTDALLAAITGRPGSFASHFVLSTPWGRARRVLVTDADGEGLTPITGPQDISIAPFGGPNQTPDFTGPFSQQMNFWTLRSFGNLISLVWLPSRIGKR